MDCCYKDVLHCVELTKCSAEFMEVVLNIYKDTLSDSKLTEVKPYNIISMLSQMCSANNLAMDSDLYAPSKDSLMYKDPEIAAIVGDNRCHREEDFWDGHTVIAMGKPSVMGKPQEGPDEAVIVRLSINKELSEINVKGIGTCPVNFVRDGCNMSRSKHCLTPYGIFSCEYPPRPAAHATCTLLDIPSLNYIRLPDIPYYTSLQRDIRLFAMCVNNTVYVIYHLSYHVSAYRNVIKRRLCMFSLHLGKPTDWCQCTPMSKALVKKAVGYEAIKDTCVIGTRIYVLLLVDKPHWFTVEYEYHLSCYDTINNEWSYPSQPPKTFKFDNPRLVAVGPDVLVVSARLDYQCAKYSTVWDQWTAYPSIPPPAISPTYNGIYLKSVQWTAFPPTSSVDTSLLCGLLHSDSNVAVHLVWSFGSKLDFYCVSSSSLTPLRSILIPLALNCCYCAVLH